jgi:signal transduction histidine kinase
VTQGKRKQRGRRLRKPHSAGPQTILVEQLHALLARQHAAWEAERATVAHEIHDELAQVLVAIKVESASLSKVAKAGEESGECLVRVRSLVDRGMRCVRKLCTQLRPGALDDLDLAAAIEWQAEEFESQTGISCDVGQLQYASLPAERATAIFRIFQEILSNVAKHAAAHHVEVSLQQRTGAVALSVRDDGKGIRPSEVTRLTSLGLLGMREKAESFGGRVLVEGVRGQGTTVTVMIPQSGDVMKAGKSHENSIGGRPRSCAAGA